MQLFLSLLLLTAFIPSAFAELLPVGQNGAAKLASAGNGKRELTPTEDAVWGSFEFGSSSTKYSDPAYDPRNPNNIRIINDPNDPNYSPNQPRPTRGTLLPVGNYGGSRWPKSAVMRPFKRSVNE